MKGKRLFAALFLLFVANAIMAQTRASLKGGLKDASDGSMMPYTNYVLLHATQFLGEALGA